jgi:hypothetical protein
MGNRSGPAMANKVLILVSGGDLHAHAVAEALRRKGGDPILWHTTDFPTRAAERLCFEGSNSSFHIEGLDIECTQPGVRTVWRRRPAYTLDESRLHPADVSFANLECAIFRRSFLSLLLPEAFWVNPADAAVSAGRKMVQHKLAVDVGLTTPATLFTNDPNAIRGFFARCGGRIVYKTLQGGSWQKDEEQLTPFTSLLAEADLVDDDLLRSTPGIYQEPIVKSYELRVTAMGNQLVAVKIFSQETNEGTIDWRRSERELRIEPYKLPPQVHKQCLALMARLGVVFGCLDFIVTPSGEFVFLEINEMGQFLFIEQRTGLPLLDMFSDFLLQGSPAFTWTPTAAPIRYGDVATTAEEQAKEASERHVAAPAQSFPEFSRKEAGVELGAEPEALGSNGG